MRGCLFDYGIIFFEYIYSIYNKVSFKIIEKEEGLSF